MTKLDIMNIWGFFFTVIGLIFTILSYFVTFKKIWEIYRPPSLDKIHGSNSNEIYGDLTKKYLPKNIKRNDKIAFLMHYSCMHAKNIISELLSNGYCITVILPDLNPFIELDDESLNKLGYTRKQIRREITRQSESLNDITAYHCTDNLPLDFWFSEKPVPARMFIVNNDWCWVSWYFANPNINYMAKGNESPHLKIFDKNIIRDLKGIFDDYIKIMSKKGGSRSLREAINYLEDLEYNNNKLHPLETSKCPD